MIREDRDPTFWRAVYEHPEVKPHVSMGHDIDIEAIVSAEQVVPLRSENGGFLFFPLDRIGRVYELHTMFRPEGWGREVLQALKEAVSEMFARGAQLITTYDVESHWRSRPPKTFRFEPCGDFALVPELNAHLRTWILTRLAWEASPARQRMT